MLVLIDFQIQFDTTRSHCFFGHTVMKLSLQWISVFQLEILLFSFILGYPLAIAVENRTK